MGGQLLPFRALQLSANHVRRKYMKPYARNGRKIRINNRSKFNAGARRVSSEFAPQGWLPYAAPCALAIIRIRKAKQCGLRGDKFRRYDRAMI